MQPVLEYLKKAIPRIGISLVGTGIFTAVCTHVFLFAIVDYLWVKVAFAIIVTLFFMSMSAFLLKMMHMESDLEREL